mgnify:CR=1 FL=1
MKLTLTVIKIRRQLNDGFFTAACATYNAITDDTVRAGIDRHWPELGNYDARGKWAA